MKKIAIVLIALLVLAMFVACDSDSDSTEVKELTQAQIEEYTNNINFIHGTLLKFFKTYRDGENKDGSDIQYIFLFSPEYQGTIINTDNSSLRNGVLALKDVNCENFGFGPYDIVIKETDVKTAGSYAFAISVSSSSDSFDIVVSSSTGSSSDEIIEISNLVINGDTYNVEPLETAVNSVK